MAAPPKEIQDALAALERLSLRRHVLTVEEARAAARILTGDPSFEFPPPPRPREAAAPSPPPEAAPTETGAAEGESADTGGGS